MIHNLNRPASIFLLFCISLNPLHVAPSQKETSISAQLKARNERLKKNKGSKAASQNPNKLSPLHIGKVNRMETIEQKDRRQREALNKKLDETSEQIRLQQKSSQEGILKIQKMKKSQDQVNKALHAQAQRNDEDIAKLAEAIENYDPSIARKNFLDQLNQQSQINYERNLKVIQDTQEVLNSYLQKSEKKSEENQKILLEKVKKETEEIIKGGNQLSSLKEYLWNKYHKRLMDKRKKQQKILEKQKNKNRKIYKQRNNEVNDIIFNGNLASSKVHLEPLSEPDLSDSESDLSEPDFDLPAEIDLSVG
ncbi:MAG: hypothetical protein AAF335_01430 [Bacteroidota bacterium]